MKLKTYIIHFGKLKKRKKEMKKQINEFLFLNVEWFIQKGYYPQKLIDKYYVYDRREWKRKAKIANRPIIPYPLTRSQKHLLINNFKVREKIAEGKEEYALVLEDDIIFENDFERKLKKILKNVEGVEWDIIYLDYLSNNYPKTNDLAVLSSRGKYECYGAGGYILKKEAAKKIVGLDEKSTLPNDEELKYRINKLGLNALWIVPPIVKQSPSYQDAEESGQNKRDKQGIKKYIYWRKKIYLKIPKKIQRLVHNLEQEIKKLYLGIK